MKKIFILVLLFCLMFMTSSQAWAQLSDIEAVILQEKFQDAENLAKQFIASNPAKDARDEAIYYLGLSQLRLERYGEARKTFGLLFDKSTKTELWDKAHLGCIDSYYMEGDYSQALSLAQALLEKSPRSNFLSLIYLKIARANLKLTHWPEAKNYLKQIIRDFPDSLEAHLAKQLLDEKRYFAVQVGAFLDRQRAENLISELKNRNEYAYIVETTDRDGKKFYRVRIGKFALLSEAQELEAKLIQLGYPTRIYP